MLIAMQALGCKTWASIRLKSGFNTPAQVPVLIGQGRQAGLDTLTGERSHCRLSGWC